MDRCNHRNMPTATSEAKIDLCSTFFWVPLPPRGPVTIFGGSLVHKYPEKDMNLSWYSEEPCSDLYGIIF